MADSDIGAFPSEAVFRAAVPYVKTRVVMGVEPSELSDYRV